MHATKTLVLIVLAPLGLWVCSALAGGEETPVTYQGQLKQAGVPVSGVIDMRISLYDAAEKGRVVAGPLIFDGQERNGPPVDVTNGLFAVELGFGADAYNERPRWLQVEVRSPHDPSDLMRYTILSPRQRIAAAPLALNVRGLNIDESGGLQISGNLQTNGEVAASAYDSNSPHILKANGVECARFDDATCNFGIGTTNPTSRLHVIGDDSNKAISAAGTVFVGKSLDESGTGLSVSRTTSPFPFPASTRTEIDGNKIDAFGGLFGKGDSPLSLNHTSTGDVLLARGGGSVGIGPVSPEAPLHVVGGTDASPTGGGSAVFGNTSGKNMVIDENEIMARNNGQTATLTLNLEGGNVLIGFGGNAKLGIGTVAPSERLDLGGGNISMGYEIVSSFESDAFCVTVSCPAGKQVLGGGCDIGVPDWVSTSTAIGTTAWRCCADVTDANVTVTAICANIK